jgi:hypothetical protein
MSLFNPLNWKRNDPVALHLPSGQSIEGIACESLPDGRVLCLPEVDSVCLSSIKLQNRSAEQPKPIPSDIAIETSHFLLQMDRRQVRLQAFAGERVAARSFRAQPM